MKKASLLITFILLFSLTLAGCDSGTIGDVDNGNDIKLDEPYASVDIEKTVFGPSNIYTVEVKHVGNLANAEKFAILELNSLNITRISEELTRNTIEDNITLYILDNDNNLLASTVISDNNIDFTNGRFEGDLILKPNTGDLVVKELTSKNSNQNNFIEKESIQYNKINLKALIREDIIAHTKLEPGNYRRWVPLIRGVFDSFPNGIFIMNDTGVEYDFTWDNRIIFNNVLGEKLVEVDYKLEDLDLYYKIPERELMNAKTGEELDYSESADVYNQVAVIYDDDNPNGSEITLAMADVEVDIIDLNATILYRVSVYEVVGINGVEGFSIFELDDDNFNIKALGEQQDNYSMEGYINLYLFGESEEVTTPDDEYVLTIVTEGAGSTVPAEGEHIFKSDQIIEVEAIAAENWLFSHWIGDVFDSNIEVTSVLMDNDKNIKAIFVEDENDIIDPGDSDISIINSNAFVSGDIEYNNDFTDDITLDRDIEISIVDLSVTIELKDDNGDPLPDDDYQVKIESDIEGIIFEDENLRFSSGDGSIDLDLVMIAQGQHTLTVEVDGLVIENNLKLNIESSNLDLNGGSIDLNGFELIVNGNIYQGGGDIIINNGSLTVNGDFRLQKRNDNNGFDFDRSSGRLVMVESDDYVLVNGNFVTESTRSHSNSLIKGVIEFKGDFEQFGTNAAYGNYSRSNFDSNGDHKAIFSGESTQNITFESTSVSGFQLVELKNSALNFNSPLRISELDMDAVINNPVNYGFSDEMDFAGNSLIIKGDYSQTANVEIDLNSGLLEVEGDFYQTRGTLKINKGRLEVKGDYRLQSLEHERVPAKLNMLDTDDYVLVEGDFVTHSYSTHVNSLEAGTMELKGDFSQLGTSGMYGYFERSNFSASDDHLVIFSGDKRQNISFESDIYSGFNRAIFDNANINLKTSVKGWRLEEDTVISNNIEHGFTENFNLDGYSLIIDGNFYMQANGTVNFNNGMMHVKGDLYQARGEFDINGGMLAVDGDYRIQSLDNKRVLARLIMLNKDDYIVVKGDFVMHSYRSHGSSLEAGVLEIKGDFSQLGTSGMYGYFERSNFSASEDHIVVFSGDGQQNVSFASSGHSQFATLIVVNETGNRIVYNTKYNLSRYSNVELNYSSLELDLNQSVQVNAEFTMEPNQTALWSSRDSSVASVSNNGLVSSEGPGVTGIKIANSGDQSLFLYLFVEVE